MPARDKPTNLKLDLLSPAGPNGYHAPSPPFVGIPFNHWRDRSGIVVGDAYHTLSLFDSKVFRCCVTSPPYWGLRDYGIPGQIGAEMELSLYLDNLTEIFREVRRVLRDDGTLWLNIGDSYTSGGRTWRQSDKKIRRAEWIIGRRPLPASSRKISSAFHGRLPSLFNRTDGTFGPISSGTSPIANLNR